MVNSVEPHSSDTEQRILDAARQQFMRFGLEGTTMQQIADAAHINKSLVHYYFRSKENLFERIFIQAFQTFVPRVMEIMLSDCSMREKIKNIVDNYIDMLMSNNFLPGFILHEINQNPDRLYRLLQHSQVNPPLVMQQLEKEIANGNIRPVDPRHLFINILAMCIFPFPARPLIQRIFFEGSDEAFDAFLKERKKEITQFVIHAICIEK
jgi:TetR/AcrR family transcriptional regulator